MGASGYSGRENIGNRIGDPELNCDIDVAFEKLKSTADKKEGCISLPADELDISNIRHTQGSRKRSRPYEGLSQHLYFLNAVYCFLE